MRLAIDADRLAGAINRQDDRMTVHSDQIQTRAQQRLQTEVDRKNELQIQISDDDSQLVELRDQRSRLDALITKGEANLRDARIELKSVVDSIRMLESEGISI